MVKKLLGTLLLALALPAFADTEIRQSTSRDVRICGVVSISDGITPVTSLALGTADEAEALREGTATLDISGATFSAITGADGCYDLTLDATATNTVGALVVVIQDDSLVYPVVERFTVLEESVYDNFYASGATLETSADVADAVRGEPCGTETADTLGDLICNDVEQTAIAVGTDGSGLTEAGGTGDHLTAVQLGTDAVDADALAATAAAEIWDVQCEDQSGGYSCRETMSLLLAEAMGTCTYTAATRTFVCSDPSGSETRFTLVYGTDLDGDRTTSTPAPFTP